MSEGREPVTLPELPSLCFGCRQNFGFAPSVAILAQAISCSNVHGVLLVHELFCFCLVQVSTTQFCSFSFLMARVSDGTNVPISLAPASSSNMGSPNGSLLDIAGNGFHACTMEEKINEIYLQLPLFIQYAARIGNCIQTLAQTVAAQSTKITNIEQIAGSLVARVTSLEQHAASGSSSPDSARCWSMLGHSNGSTGTGSLGSHGPESSDDNRNTRRRLDTLSSPEDEQARSAVLLRFPCEQYHEGITKWINNLWEESNMLADKKTVTIHCKAGSVSARLVFKTKAKCQDIVARYKDDGISFEINSPLCCAKTTITVRQSKSLEDREIGKQFAPLWKVLAEKLEVLFPEGDDICVLIVPALDARSQILSMKDRRNGVGKLVFKLAPF